MKRRRPMPDAVVERYNGDLADARAAVRSDQIDRAWAMLEEAHVLSQPWAWPHIRVHGLMLLLGWQTRDRREVAGQLLRIIVAGPGSLAGRYPVGNTGRASVPSTQPMPMADDLRDLFAEENGGRARVGATDG